MIDLADVVIVNESHRESEPGDVTIFRSAGEACNYLEHWWVKSREGCAFTASGDRLTLDVDEDSRVIVVDRQPVVGGPSIVHGWLRAAAASVLKARIAKALKNKTAVTDAELEQRLPQSIDGLVEYVGFTR